jgi:hypothetical protein
MAPLSNFSYPPVTWEEAQYRNDAIESTAGQIISPEAPRRETGLLKKKGELLYAPPHLSLIAGAGFEGDGMD